MPSTSRQLLVVLFLSCLSSSAIAATGSTLYNQLFPSTYSYSSGFTTADVDVGPNIKKIGLSASDLNVYIGHAPDPVEFSGKQAFQATYNKGAYAGSGIPQGLNFVMNGSHEFTAACEAGAREVVVGYSLFWEEGFEFAKIAKLPGACESTIIYIKALVNKHTNNIIVQ